MAKNKGYTLIELVIVIAIMAILSGASFITVGIIKDAKRSTAVNTLNNQISSCLIRTKAVSDAANGTSAPLCMVIRKRSDGAYAIMTGYNDGAVVHDSSNNILDPDTDEDCDAILPKEVLKIVYTASDNSQKINESEMLIQFVKADGSVKYGAGKYDLYTKKNGNESIYATIYLDAVSGNHYIK